MNDLHFTNQPDDHLAIIMLMHLFIRYIMVWWSTSDVVWTAVPRVDYIVEYDSPCTNIGAFSCVGAITVDKVVEHIHQNCPSGGW